MTIAQAFNDIAVAQGGTPSTSGTIAGAIDALNDALAGSDQQSAQTIEDAVRLLGQNIGGSSVTVEALTATENKTYTAPEGKAYSPVTVNVSGGGTEYDIKCYTATDQGAIEETTERMLLFDFSTMTPSSEPTNKAKGGDVLVTTSTILKAILCESFPPDIQTGIDIPNSGSAVVMPNAKLAVIFSDVEPI